MAHTLCSVAWHQLVQQQASAQGQSVLSKITASPKLNHFALLPHSMPKQAGIRPKHKVQPEQGTGHSHNPGQPDTTHNSKQRHHDKQQKKLQQDQPQQQQLPSAGQTGPTAQQQSATAVSPASKRKAPAAADATHKHKHRKQHSRGLRQPNLGSIAGQAAAVVVDGSAAPGVGAAAVPDPKDDEVRRLFRSWAWKREHRWVAGLWMGGIHHRRQHGKQGFRSTQKICGGWKGARTCA